MNTRRLNRPNKNVSWNKELNRWRPVENPGREHQRMLNGYNDTGSLTRAQRKLLKTNPKGRLKGNRKKLINAYRGYIRLLRSKNFMENGSTRIEPGTITLGKVLSNEL